MRPMGEGWTSLATKRTHDDSNTDDDGLTEVIRQQADLDNMGDLFDASDAEAGSIDVSGALEDPFKGEGITGPSENEKLAAKVYDLFKLT